MADTPEAHLAWILERIGRTEPHFAPLHAAHGSVLAEDVRARHDLPPWDSSAMDGYAVIAAEISSASEQHPVALRIVAEVAAGSPEDPVLPGGSAVRIMTGAPVPTQADAVIPVELTVSDRADDPWAEAAVQMPAPMREGANVRRRGEDVRAGTIIARAGERIDSARASALAAAGIDEVQVHRAPSIAVVSTGSELQCPGAPLERGQIPESNSLLITGVLAEAGFTAATVEHRTDDAAALASRLAELAATHDAVITSGGVGPGQHDVVRIALENEPGIRALRVAVRPGQPQCAGRHSAGAFVFGLPGNPVSAAVGLELFVLPALKALAGSSDIHRISLTATAAEAWRAAPGRLQVLPVRLARTPQGLVCAPAVAPGRVSHSVVGHAARDGYALVSPHHGDVEIGDRVPVIITRFP